MSQMICPKCQKQIDSNSAFCTFCGEKIDQISSRKGIKKDPTSRKQDKTLFVLISEIILCTLFIGIIVALSIKYYSLSQKYEELASRQSELTQNYDSISKQLQETTVTLNETNDQLTRKSNSYSALEREKRTLQSNLDSTKRTISDLYSDLKTSKTTNGIISTNNKVFCVKKGESATIKITWNKTATIYMRPIGFYVDAEWSGNDVKITGEADGVSTIEFSSDKAGKNNVFHVTVICYE